LYNKDFLFQNKIKFYKVPLKDNAFFNLSLYQELGRVAFNRTAYCERHDKENIRDNTFQEKLYEVNLELAKYFEGVIASWGRVDEFSDLISNEYYNTVYSELKNICHPDSPLSTDEQEVRINDILKEETMKQHLNNIKTSKTINPYQKALMAALRDGNGKGALQLVAGKNGTKKVTSKVTRFIRHLFKS